MPAKSKAQSKYLNMKFGHAWVKQHGFDTPTAGLPPHLKGAASGKKKLKRKY
jgi:hypothetical protein